MTIETSRTRVQVDGELVERMAGLLARYPVLSEEEIEALVAFLARGPLIERGTLLGRPGMADQFALLKRDRARGFGMSRTGLLVIAAMVAALVAACALLWDFGL